MVDYVISYFGEPSFNSPEEGSQYQKKWRSWIGGLGDALVNPGTPLKVSKVVRADSVIDGERSVRLTGYSIVRADNMDAAVEMVKSCPHLEHGTIEVAEVMDIGM